MASPRDMRRDHGNSEGKTGNHRDGRRHPYRAVSYTHLDVYKRQQEQNKEIADQRKSMVGSGDRSERIRTYNFPQGRVSDHRIGVTIYKLDNFLDGDLDEIIDCLLYTSRCV